MNQFISIVQAWARFVHNRKQKQVQQFFLKNDSSVFKIVAEFGQIVSAPNIKYPQFAIKHEVNSYEMMEGELNFWPL